MTDNMSAGRDSFPLDSFDIEKWSVQVEYAASAVSNKEEELTEAELDNFGTLLQNNVQLKNELRGLFASRWAWLKRRKLAKRYVVHCRIVWQSGIKLSTTASTRAILKANARDSGASTVPDTNLPTPLTKATTSLSDPAESSDSGRDIRLLMNTIVSLAEMEARRTDPQSMDHVRATPPQPPQPASNRPGDSQLCLSWTSSNGPSFLEKAENVDISDSNIVAARGDYNNIHLTVNFHLHVDLPERTPNIEIRPLDECHSEISREESQHIGCESNPLGKGHSEISKEESQHIDLNLDSNVHLPEQTPLSKLARWTRAIQRSPQQKPRPSIIPAFSAFHF